ncbi:hypothetical protein N0V88_007233 [Collariella sp. IMI 366227]|nr:hypothetical protein N0V88_007233 [Collariella sp. IMI 366227]
MAVPADKEQSKLMLLPAVCFQTGAFGSLGKEVENALKSGSLETFSTRQITLGGLEDVSPGGGPGLTTDPWVAELYMIICLFYVIAALVSIGRVIQRGHTPDGKKNRFINGLQRRLPFFFKIKTLFYAFFTLYLPQYAPILIVKAGPMHDSEDRITFAGQLYDCPSLDRDSSNSGDKEKAQALVGVYAIEPTPDGQRDDPLDPDFDQQEQKRESTAIEAAPLPL